MIIGEITNIIELARNSNCCNHICFLKLTSKKEIMNPIEVTRIPVVMLKIKEFFKATKKYFFIKQFSKYTVEIKFNKIYIMGENNMIEKKTIIE